MKASIKLNIIDIIKLHGMVEDLIDHHTHLTVNAHKA